MTDELTESTRVDLETPDLSAANRAAFEELLPGVLADGVIDAERLKELLDVDVIGAADDRERYGLSWAGKNEAVRSLQTPSRGTLNPDLEASADWDTAQNVFIEGDNLEVLKLLQKAYNDQVRLIYIDPPYNTGKGDFVYDDEFGDGLQRYLEFSGQVDASGNRVAADPDRTGRMHSRWMSMLYPRLLLARNLLAQDGLIFVSIDDNEFAALRLLLDEVFGPSNFLATLIWDRGHSQQQGQFKEYHEYVVVYARSRSRLKPFRDPSGGEVIAGAIKKPSRSNPVSEFTFPAGVRVEAPDSTEFSGVWGDAEVTELREGSFVVENGVTREAVTLAAAWTQKGQMEAFYYGNDEVFDTRGQKVVEFYFSSTGKLKYRKERTALTPSTVQRWGTQGSASGAQAEILGAGVFDLPKPVGLVRDIVSWCTHGSDVVLDFFAGSGTTAHAVALQNAADGARRRFICVNLPEPTPAGSPARAAGFETVSAITERRIHKVMETVEGASDIGLRVQRLAPSNFHDATPADPEELLDLRESTLNDSEHVMEYVVQEVLLKEGVRLDAPWERHNASNAPVVIADRVAVVMTLDLTQEIADAALALEPKVVVFLEDGFAGADAVKANAFTNAKSAGIVMKTV